MTRSFEKLVDEAADELTELLRENGHKIDDSNDRALLLNVLTGCFTEARAELEAALAQVAQLREALRRDGLDLAWERGADTWWRAVLRGQETVGTGTPEDEAALAAHDAAVRAAAMVIGGDDAPTKCATCGGEKFVRNTHLPRLDDPEWWPCPDCGKAGA